VLPLLAALLSFHSWASALDNGLAMTPYDCSRMIHTHACPAAPLAPGPDGSNAHTATHCPGPWGG
jgi:hypothetical protein